MSFKIFRALSLAFVFTAFSGFDLNHVTKKGFPYRKAGLTDRQAAAHLLSRFTFGARPDEVDQVLKVGIEKWFRLQLEGRRSDEALNDRLKSYDALTLSNTEVLAQFPDGGEVRKMVIADGFVSKDSIALLDKGELKEKLKAYREKKGLREERELFRQFINQKIVRATYGQNQLHEVLTDFWFNHFNVSITKNQCARFIPAYERDVIRPNVAGKFQDLLIATAKSPAMLVYLDNFSSMGINDNFGNRKNNRRQLKANLTADQEKKLERRKKSQGLNENYARELMELHTLGVDGGYTQKDVTEAARVLTGWTIYPMKEYGASANIRKVLDKIGEENLKSKGFVHDGDFLFAINRHDPNEKTVLGKKFKSGGYQDGVQLLTLLARHPSTAKFICKKLAVRFVSDNPPQTLIDKMVEVFNNKNGRISEVLTAIVSSSEFWSAEAMRAKTKSPFEYAISSVRALNADVKMPYQLNEWVTRMGLKLYFYQAPTGFPDRGQYWINTGSLLNRMNFGLAIASKKIPGIAFDLLALNNHHEPESAKVALSIYAQLMLPERNIDPTIQRLTPLINHPTIQKNIEEATRKEPVVSNNDDLMMNENYTAGGPEKKEHIKKSFGDNSLLAQVVGIIIGSPEFQRR